MLERMNEKNLEIRKMSLNNHLELARILEDGISGDRGWEKLMAIIPKTLARDKYRCDYDLQNNPPKYSSTDVRTIKENATSSFSCSQILLDEWGTSGRVRPTLGHLLYLLVKAQLFRAADYIAIEVLKEVAPRRPKKGPAARISTKLQEINASPRSTTNNVNNLDVAQKTKIVPKIVITEFPSVEDFNAPDLSILNNSTSKRLNESENVTSSSGNSGNYNAPDLSILNEVFKSEAEKESSAAVKMDTYNSPDLSIFNKSSQSGVDVDNVPDLSILNNTAKSEEQQNYNVPDLSVLNNSESVAISNELLPNLSIINDNYNDSESSENNIPKFDLINSPASNQNYTQTTSSAISDSGLLPVSDSSSKNQSSLQKTSRSCVSPLPNLTLNTQLPHFTYGELERATNDFNETPYCKETEVGNFLGAGGFGTVFLARNLMSDKPVAVKKSILENKEKVGLDDNITKQFRNEVEVLSNYTHEHLLSLLGYSCDGATYCLIYEYMPGGSLKDRLQNKDNKLIWTDRFYIALGTARAIYYLHTAESTPLIHRDVKSANILLDDSNKAKLCDFGLVKMISGQSTMSVRTTTIGTRNYMAPEAHRGDVSVKLDTYSFGAVLLELLTSLSPLDEDREGRDLVTHVDQVCEDDIKPLLDVSVGDWTANGVSFGEELYSIAQQCLEDKKNKRPDMVTVTKLLTDLAQKCI